MQIKITKSRRTEHRMKETYKQQKSTILSIEDNVQT